MEARRRIPRGESLFRAGASQSAFYAVRAGFLKSVVHSAGRPHIVGFLMPGDVAGLDGWASHVHASDAIALADCEVCEISTYRAEIICDFQPRIAHHLRGLVAHELARSQEHAAALSCLSVRGRLARFLMDLGMRWQERGYSAREFLLPMSRRDIAQHLALSPETVSRLLAEFQSRGWIRHGLRSMEILDEEALRDILCAWPPSPRLPQRQASASSA
jgi:CRP/FNR family transcriptional regulator